MRPAGEGSTEVGWGDFASADADLAGAVFELFTSYRHHTMATLRKDGSPRISGTEVEFEGGDLLIGMMPGTRRAADLRRDPRVALHSHSVDPPEADHGSWSGEAKLSGKARPLGADRGDGSAGPDRFRIEIGQVVLTRIGDPADHLVIDSWDPVRGRVSHRR